MAKNTVHLDDLFIVRSLGEILSIIRTNERLSLFRGVREGGPSELIRHDGLEDSLFEVVIENGILMGTLRCAED